MTERDEQALREALRTLGPDEPVDPGAARRRAGEKRQNRHRATGVLVALVLIAGVVGLPTFMSGGGADTASAPSGAQAGRGDPGTGAGAESAPDTEDAPGDLSPTSGSTQRTDPAPTGWRTEYYRDIAFEVPQAWGYSAPPDSAWCADGGRELTAEQRNPYVWLGTSRAVRAIGCGPLPRRLLTEHVEVIEPGPAVSYVERADRVGNWWVVTRFAGSAILTATTKDRTLADRILASARLAPVDAPCPASSPVAAGRGERPTWGAEPGGPRDVEQVVVCQYEPVVDPADATLPKLRAVAQLTGGRAQSLADSLQNTPMVDRSCTLRATGQGPNLALVVRIDAGGETHEMYVAPPACPNGPGDYVMIMIGPSDHVLTAFVCDALSVPPVQLQAPGTGTPPPGTCEG